MPSTLNSPSDPVAPPITQYLTTAEVAQRFGISEAVVKKWRRKKTGPNYVTFGTSIRYKSDDLDAWIRSNTVIGAA